MLFGGFSVARTGRVIRIERGKNAAKYREEAKTCSGQHEN